MVLDRPLEKPIVGRGDESDDSDSQQSKKSAVTISGHNQESHLQSEKSQRSESSPVSE